MRLATLLFFLILQAAVAEEVLRSGCSQEDEQIATVSAADGVEVHGARAGENPTCYKVTVTKPGLSSLTGYVLGEALPAVSRFVDDRERASKEAAEAEARRAATPPKIAKDPANPGAPEKLSYFADFAGRDSRGKAVDLRSLKGRAVLVTFWSPKDPSTAGHLSSVQVLYQQLHKQGLDAVGISTDPNTSLINKALDDVTLSWPQMPDKEGLAARYGVNPRAGKSFVLDSSHRIVASGPMGPEMEKTLRNLLAAPEGQ